jgi:hypothetical protein
MSPDSAAGKSNTLDLPDLNSRGGERASTGSTDDRLPTAFQKDLPFSGYTRVCVTFDLALNSLTQHELLLRNPDLIRVPGVQVNSRLIRDLLAAIVNDPTGEPNPAVHIRHVIENEVQSGERHASQRRQMWDISGRQYHGVFPVDFHMVLIGDSLDGSDSYDRQCILDLRVQAVVCDAETRKAVDDITWSLQDTARQVLTKPLKGGPDAS